MDLKSLLYEAYHKGTQELLYVVPFVAKVLESCAKSRVSLLAITNHCDSITNHCDSITNHCDSITYHCDSITNHCDSITNHCDSITNHCDSITNHCDFIQGITF